MIDNGLDTGHWEFSGLAATDTCFAPNDCGNLTHGTPVASVIAAQRNQPFPNFDPTDLASLRALDVHGIAWGIDSLEMLSVALGSADPNRSYRGVPVADVDDFIVWLARRFEALSTSPDFVNMSFGANGLIENYRNVTFGPDYDPAVAVLAQTGTASGKAILVIAAGNDNGRKCDSPEPNCVGGRLDATSPAFMAALQVIEPSLRSHVVAVVAAHSGRGIAGFSNRCGIAAKWCIAAPGAAIVAALYRQGPQPGTIYRGYNTWNGTSLAAPFVTGGLAVMKHWFKAQLTNEDLLARLYATARVTPDRVPAGGACPAHLDLDGDLSDCELSSIFGRGMMDIGAATAPVGSMSFTLAGGPPLDRSRILTGPATGDGMRLSLSGQEVALFDELGAPFWVDAGLFVQERAPHGLATRISRWLADLDGRPGAAAGPALAQGPGSGVGNLRLGLGGPAAGHLGLVPQPAAADIRFGEAVLSAVGSTAPGGEAGVYRMDSGARGFTISWQRENRPALTAGWVEETDTLFGSSAQGAFGRFSSRLGLVGAAGSFDAGGWHVDASAEIGRATPQASGMLAESGKGIVSTAFSATASRQFGDRTLRLSVEQPLRIESGNLSLTLPAGRTPGGQMLHREAMLDLEPSGRQIDLGIDWTQSIAHGALLRLGAVLSRNPGHSVRQPPETIVLAGLHFGL